MATGILGILIEDLRSRTRDVNKDIIGSATATLANKLIDSTATFISDGIVVGDTIYNTTDTTFALVTALDSEIQLALDTDIFVSGENYRKIGQANSELLWSDSDWIGYLNDSQREIAERALILPNTYWGPTSMIISQSGVEFYSIHPSILLIERLIASWDRTTPLTKTTERELDDNYPGWRTLAASKPEYYIEYSARNEIRLVPKPSADYANSVTGTCTPPNPSYTLYDSGATFITDGVTTDWIAYHISSNSWSSITQVVSETTLLVSSNDFTSNDDYILSNMYLHATVKRSYLNALSLTNTTPELESKFYEDMKLWALHKAYLKQDSQTRNVELSNLFYSQFEARVGPRPNANIQRIMKEEPSYMSIGIRRS